MVKTENKEGSLETLNVGIVGHIDHGKTTLLQKLSGKWASLHSEELKRGITIKLGYADIVIYKDGERYGTEKKGIPVRHVSFIDAPGHEMLMATMLSGAAMIDAAVLVVAANEGIKPQTREHLLALQAKGVKSLIVAQNKIDLVDIEQAKKNYKDIKELIKGKYDNAPIIPVSAQQGINIDSIFKALAEVEMPKRDEEGKPFFIVARSFDINRPGSVPEKLHGAVLGGTLKKGKLKVGDEIEIKPGRIVKEGNQMRYETIKTKVVKLFRGSNEEKELTPGGSMSIETELDMALGKNDSLSGNVSSVAGGLPEVTMTLKVQFKLFEVSQIKPSEMLMLSVNTAITGGIVKHIRGDTIEVNLKVPVVPSKGENVGIARNVGGHWRLIGYGKII